MSRPRKIAIIINRYSFWVCLGIVFFSAMSLFLLHEDVYIKVFDELNPDLVYRRILSVDHNYLKGPLEIIQSFMGGIPRHCFPSSLNFLVLFFILFTPIYAFLINVLVVRLFAYVGMFLLLKNHLFEREKALINPFLIAMVSLCFALLPFHFCFGLSIAGQPLLLYAFLNILKYKASIKDYLIIVLFPFYSSFVLAGIFISIALGFVFLWNWVEEKKANINFMLMLIAFGMIYLGVEYQLIYAHFVDKTYISHRVEWNIPLFWGIDLHGFIDRLKTFLVDGVPFSHHAVTLHAKISDFILPIALVVGIKERNYLKRLCLFLAIIFLITLWLCFYHWYPVTMIRQKYFFLRAFQWDRFYFLLPTLWYIVFALSLCMISKIKDIGNNLVVLFLLMQLFYVVTSNPELKRNVRFLAAKYLGTSCNVKYLSFKQYFSENLFSQIALYIDKPKSSFRVIAIGLNPSIAQYNGFYTLDGFMPDYPLAYKHEFKKIIERELDKNAGNRKCFDNWGSACNIYVAEAVIIDEKNEVKKNIIKQLDLNMNQLRKMGCEYIFSEYEIENPQKDSLSLLKVFKNENSPWEIFLYQIKKKEKV